MERTCESGCFHEEELFSTSGKGKTPPMKFASGHSQLCLHAGLQRLFSKMLLRFTFSLTVKPGHLYLPRFLRIHLLQTPDVRQLLFQHTEVVC